MKLIRAKSMMADACAGLMRNEGGRRGLCLVAMLLLNACVNSTEARSFTEKQGSMNATVYSIGGDCKSCRPGGKPAKPGDNCTGILLKEGQCYEFQAKPSEDFADASIKLNNLEGWDFVLYQPLCFMKRRPLEPFFTLIGTIDGKKPFRIREGMCWKAPASGELVCYLNDWSCMYGNNKGSIRLQVTPCPAAKGAGMRAPPQHKH